MPVDSRLHSLLEGLLDDASLSDTEGGSIEEVTPNKRLKYKIGINCEAESTNGCSKQDDRSFHGAEMVTKRDYQDMPPYAIDAAGKPKKKIKIIDLDKYDAVEKGAKHENLVGSIITHKSSETKKEETQIHNCEENMDIDQTVDPQQQGGALMNTNARTRVYEDIVQHGDTGRYHPRAQEIGDGQKVPPKSHINQVFLSHLKHDTKNHKGNLNTLEKNVELDKNNSKHSASHTLGKTILPMPGTDSGLIDQPGLNTKEDKEIIDMIEEVVESSLSGSVQIDAQNVDKRIISKSSTKRVLPSQSELNVKCDFEDDPEPNQQDNIRRPKYKSSPRIREGYVSWWSNVLGKGQISERHTKEVRTIHWWQLKPHYGALHSGVAVQYQWEYGRFEKFWVVQGMPFVL